MARRKAHKNYGDYLNGQISEENLRNGRNNYGGANGSGMQFLTTMMNGGAKFFATGAGCNACGTDDTADCCWVLVATTQCTFFEENGDESDSDHDRRHNHNGKRKHNGKRNHDRDHDRDHDHDRNHNGKHNHNHHCDRHDDESDDSGRNDHSDSHDDRDCSGRHGGCCWQVFSTTGCSDIPRNPDECCWIIIATTACST